MTVVRSVGQLAAIDGSAAPVAGTGGLRWWEPTGWGTLMSDYASIWKTQPQVRKVVGFLARNIAQLNLTLYRRLSDTDRERIDAHPLALTLRHPLGWGAQFKMSKTLFLETLVSDRCIYDNAYWLKRPTGDGVQLVPIPPMMIEPIGPDWLPPEGYVLNGHIDLAPERVVHFRGYNAADRRTGLSPIESLRQILVEDLASTEARQQLWERGARMSGVIERPREAADWPDHARERFMADWREAWTGDGPEAGGTPVLEEGMTYKPTTFSARDAQWLEAKKLTREEVAAAYHVPQPMVGILDRATFSNVTDLHKSLYQDTVPPWTTGIEEDIEQQLVPDYEDLVAANAYVEFNLQEKLRGDFLERARIMSTATGGPWLARNEARALDNRPRLDDPSYDELITPLNVTVGGQASPTDSAPPVSGTVARFLERCGRSTLGRWVEVRDGRREIGTVWQPERWGRELLADLDAAGLDGGGDQLAAQILEMTRAAVMDALAAADPEQALPQQLAAVETASESLISQLQEELCAPSK